MARQVAINFPRRDAFAAAAALLGILLAGDFAPAAAKTVNTCAVQYDYQKRRLKEGMPVTVTGLLKIDSESSGILADLRNEDESCVVMIEGTDAQMQQLATCGSGAQATISGKITEELFLQAVVPESISCE